MRQHTQANLRIRYLKNIEIIYYIINVSDFSLFLSIFLIHYNSYWCIYTFPVFKIYFICECTHTIVHTNVSVDIHRDRKKHWISWIWSHRCFGSTWCGCWEPNSVLLNRAVRTIDNWATSTYPIYFFLFSKKLIL